ncbi:MAG: hypothetical protein AAF433_11285 [Bacteroidota bacterium]
MHIFLRPNGWNFRLNSIVVSALLISLLSFVACDELRLTEYSTTCGEFFLPTDTSSIDSFFVLDPVSYQSEVYITIKYEESDGQYVCYDTLMGGVVIREIGTIEGEKNNFLLSEERVIVIQPSMKY